MNRIIIIGCGYVGTRLARLWKEHGADVACLVRTPESCVRLAGEGCAAATLLLDDPQGITLPDTTGSVIYYFVPPPGGGSADTRARNFIAALLQSKALPSRMIYMSATSVYSEVHGGTVSEGSETAPSTSMGKRRLDAEHAFRGFGAVTGVPVVILRTSGIYGPGRLPLTQIRQGQPLVREEESGPSNRIHVDDLAEICRAAALRGESGDIFNVSDGHPCSMTAYFNACADALGYPRQPQVPLREARQAMSPLMYSYACESRVVNNSLMLERLGVVLRYPSMSEGIAASVRAMYCR
jgi:nucleoside-diphosphate-sugar epimerase